MYCDCDLKLLCTRDLIARLIARLIYSSRDSNTAHNDAPAPSAATLAPYISIIITIHPSIHPLGHPTVHSAPPSAAPSSCAAASMSSCTCRTISGKEGRCIGCCAQHRQMSPRMPPPSPARRSCASTVPGCPGRQRTETPRSLNRRQQRAHGIAWHGTARRTWSSGRSPREILSGMDPALAQPVHGREHDTSCDVRSDERYARAQAVVRAATALDKRRWRNGVGGASGGVGEVGEVWHTHLEQAHGVGEDVDLLVEALAADDLRGHPKRRAAARLQSTHPSSEHRTNAGAREGRACDPLGASGKARTIMTVCCA
jgi:hypothetical protein